jgi:hypothetical protein
LLIVVRRGGSAALKGEGWEKKERHSKAKTDRTHVSLDISRLPRRLSRALAAPLQRTRRASSLAITLAT